VKVNNAAVRRKSGMRAVTSLIKSNRIGLMRMDNPKALSRLLNWRSTYGKRKRGQPRNRWEDIITKDLEDFGWMYRVWSRRQLTRANGRDL